jgi:phenylalanyl-tRNA synthetase alpha chain
MMDDGPMSQPPPSRDRRAQQAMTLSDELERVATEAREALEAAPDADAVGRVRHELLGRSGRLTSLLRQLGSVPADERPALGQRANEVRRELEGVISARLEALRAGDLEARLGAEAIDMSAPGRPVPTGHLHPVPTLTRDLREIFHAYGFEVFEGPEVETDEYNFELLNIPPDHPARDLWDTLFVAEPGSVEGGRPEPARDGTILRTHTSPVQMRAMRALDAPIRVITPGRCFRYEAVDASHGFEFFQLEGLVVDRDTSLADLKGMLEEVARALYGRDVRTRFRPGYYPFTEPSVAFDIGCLVCGGEGCPACKRSGWMTILGAGMVHPTVLRNGGFDPDEFQGYAFGMGPDRMAMLRHAIGDIRLFFSADLRFVTQFAGGR